MNRFSLLLITGNPNKLREFNQILGPKFELTSEKVDLLEIQGTIEEIAQKKAIQAYNMFKRPVIVQDTSLCLNAYKGLPGPYIKWFLQSIGPQGIAKMTDPFEDKSAYGLCAISFMNKNFSRAKIFIGRTNGNIVHPRGSQNFGWDPIFLPEGSSKTYAEMSNEEKNSISHRFKAIQQMKKYFLSDKFQQQNL